MLQTTFNVIRRPLLTLFALISMSILTGCNGDFKLPNFPAPPYPQERLAEEPEWIQEMEREAWRDQERRVRYVREMQEDTPGPVDRNDS